jgi:hypothetical protein
VPKSLKHAPRSTDTVGMRSLLFSFAIVLVCLGAAVGAFLAGRGSGADLSLASRAGAVAGYQEGARAGMNSGRHDGYRAGYQAGYHKAYVTAYRHTYRQALKQ